MVLKQDGRFYHLKTGQKLCPENDHLNTGLSGFEMVTVISSKLKKIDPPLVCHADIVILLNS